MCFLTKNKCGGLIHLRRVTDYRLPITEYGVLIDRSCCFISGQKTPTLSYWKHAPGKKGGSFYDTHIHFMGTILPTTMKPTSDADTAVELHPLQCGAPVVCIKPAACLWCQYRSYSHRQYGLPAFTPSQRPRQDEVCTRILFPYRITIIFPMSAAYRRHWRRWSIFGSMPLY